MTAKETPKESSTPKGLRLTKRELERLYEAATSPHHLQAETDEEGAAILAKLRAELG